MPTIFAVKATGTGSAPAPVVATTPAPTIPLNAATGTGLAPEPAVSTNAPTISAVVATGTGLAVAPEANLSPNVQAVVAKGTGRAPEPGINLLTYFTLRGYIKTVVADEADLDFDPEIKGINATVTITPKAAGFDVIQAVTQTPPALVILSPIKARIDDGRMMLIAGQVDVRLVANTPVLGLGTAPLVYKVEFTNVVFNQETQQIASFEFAAPTSDTVIDIASVPRVSASPSAGTILMQGPPGPVGATGPAGVVADGSVTTPKIVDANVTSAKLSSGVQTSLGKADSAVQSAGLTKTAVGLGNVDNTSDVNKPVSTAAQTALDGKQFVIVPTAVKTAAYTAVVGDLIPADATAGGFTITLPPAPADKSIILVKKLDSTANTVTVSRNGTDVFNVASGASTLQLVLQDQTVVLQYNTSGGIWYVTAHGMPPASLDTRYVTPAGVQTLTSKTLTSPKVNEIRDTNNNVIFSLTPAAAAINYVGVGNASTGAPYFAVGGGETDIALDFYTKGLGSFRMKDGNSQRLLQADTVAAAVNYPLVSNSATLGRIKYGAAGTDANIDTDITSKGTGVVRVNNIPVFPEQFCTLTSAYTLTSQTAAQKLFNTSANGAITLPIGSYFFECFFTLSAMSASSGSFGFALGGTATIAGQLWQADANKDALAPATPVGSVTTVNTAANTTLIAANTTPTGWARITGKVRVSVAGTLILQVSLGVAAAAVVGVDSYFRIWQVGSNTVTSVGSWS